MEQQQIKNLKGETKEMFEIFYTDYETDLKSEFLELADRKDEMALEGSDFEKYCLDEFYCFLDNLKTKQGEMAKW